MQNFRSLSESSVKMIYEFRINYFFLFLFVAEGNIFSLVKKNDTLNHLFRNMGLGGVSAKCTIGYGRNPAVWDVSLFSEWE